MVSDPNLEFYADNDNVMEIQKLIERLPSATESAQVTRLIGRLSAKRPAQWHQAPNNEMT